ncbi:L-amino acid N-acyltransferase YncA [Flavobacterium limicola]|uniref:L-amino acid N-acyltransferase YncA n=1 Tax=Flavobacterium limicola TaxID=180441 RepID=A0A495RYS5_9FLAO|nr:GNAT family N-acetyltransferase [Flavobacterium limicola]RKS92490.1 L-amino acid N-acyltransferase YncA [Flavobacterium limicola]
MNYHFRTAELSEIDSIWEILQQAIQRRKKDGSTQWQDGYPNPEVIQKDIEKGEGFVLADGETIIGYSAVLINDEPAYATIEGNWLTNDDFVVMHRVAISEKYLGKGLAKLMLKNIEDFALSNNIFSVKADTNFDNPAMMKIFETLGYIYCGEVFFRGSPRKAYEKVLHKQD